MIESPDIIERLKTQIENGGSFMALFDRSVIQRSRALELVEMLLESLPEEMDQARGIIEQRDEFLEDAKRQAGEIFDEAVRKAERLVDADTVTDEARKHAENIRMDSDRYVVERLERLEHELVKLLDEVRAGIQSMGGQADNVGFDRDDEGFSLDKS